MTPHRPLPPLDPPTSLLLALLADQPVEAHTLAEADWEALIALAEEHKLAPMVYARLKRRHAAYPPEAARQLRTLYLASVTRNSRIFAEIEKCLRALGQAGLPVIPLKGACLAETVYGNLALRALGDVDLLVKPADLPAAVQVLQALGYAAIQPFDLASEQAVSQHLPQFTKPGGVAIELHWTILNPGFRQAFTPAELEQLWARAVPVTLGRMPSQMFAPADLLLHLCLHLALHHYFDAAGLRDYLDLAMVCRHYGRQLDWEGFTARANRWGIAPAAWLALRLAEEWMAAPIPPEVWSALQAPPPEDALLDWIRHKTLSGVASSLRTNVAPFAGQARLADKLTVLRQVVFPPRAVMEHMYGVPASSWRIWLHYPACFGELWSRYGATLWRLLRRDPELTDGSRQEARLRDYLR